MLYACLSVCVYASGHVPLIDKREIVHYQVFYSLNLQLLYPKVKFLRPADDRGGNNNDLDDDDIHNNNNDDEKKWFNIFTLHQNRDFGRGSKNCVHESMIPEWMDLVVWGHEHECQIAPTESLVGTFRLVQPGSSVATSLTEGESRRKQIGLLEIKGQQFRLSPITLTNVRGFAVGNVNLGDVARDQGGNLDVEDPKVEERMMEVLATEVEALVRYLSNVTFCFLVRFLNFAHLFASHLHVTLLNRSKGLEKSLRLHDKMQRTRQRGCVHWRMNLVMIQINLSASIPSRILNVCWCV